MMKKRNTRSRFRLAISIPAGLYLLGGLLNTAFANQPWTRHVIDNGLKGADGIRITDFNADGQPDIVTGWEESGKVCAYINPGPEKSATKWPRLHVGKASDVEDAVAVDLDDDGSLDIVSASEGKNRSINIHWNGNPPDDISSNNWNTQTLPPSMNRMKWMYVCPHDMDGKNGIDLIAGGRGKNAEIGWFESPADPRQLDQWQWHPLTSVGWTMSILNHDVNGDGYADILYSDQRAPTAGVYWLEHPGKKFDISTPWKKHILGLADLAYDDGTTGKLGKSPVICFLSLDDMDGDGTEEILVGADRYIAILKKSDAIDSRWETHLIPLPETSSGAKCVQAADLDNDGKLELVYTTLTASEGHTVGVAMLKCDDPFFRAEVSLVDIGGPDGTKFDLLEFSDLDNDGDLDLITCEERTNLGVMWYENPAQ